VIGGSFYCVRWRLEQNGLGRVNEYQKRLFVEEFVVGLGILVVGRLVMGSGTLFVGGLVMKLGRIYAVLNGRWGCMRSAVGGKDVNDEDAYVEVVFIICVVGEVGRSGHAGWCNGRRFTECTLECGPVIDSERLFMVLDVRWRCVWSGAVGKDVLL